MWKFLVVFLSVISMSFVSSYARQLESYRLPNNTTPESYYINLEFNDFDAFNTEFIGNVLVVIKVHEDTSVIALHCTVLISKVNLTKIVNGNEIEVAQNYDLDARKQFLLVQTTEEIIKRGTELFLNVDFIGKISTEVEEGVFMKSYVNKNGEKSFYVATHVKPNFARRIFPCYDEPSFKSSFKLTLFHSEKYEALSSLGKRRSITDPTPTRRRRITIFDQSDNFMSPYRIAFVISEFEATERTTRNGISLRVFAKPEQQQLLAKENAIFALETTERVLELFSELFEIPLQFGTLDQVALPHSHHCGDGESYGIAFYCEKCLLDIKNVTSAYDREHIALAITNNVCHQLLGNLLTPSWWSTSLWISEGLCRFYEHHMSVKVHPTIVLEGTFSATTMESALCADLSSSHSMSRYEESPRALRELFDVIAYNKSASLFRMFYHSFTALTFTEGLKIYFNEAASNPLGVTESQQLYDAWQHAIDYNGAVLGSGYKVSELFGNWEQQEGFPILYVERSYNNHRVRFTQNRFTESIKNGKLYDSLWHIPITFTFKNDTSSDQLSKKLWLSKVRQLEIKIDDLRPHSYLLVNVDRVGYYRVQYDEANWMLIANELSRGNRHISPASRAMLINDAGKFYMSGILNVRIFLELTRHLQTSVDYVPWLAATNNMEHMRRMLDNDDELSNDFKIFLQSLFSNLFTIFTIEHQPNESNYHKHIRNIAIEWSCKVHLNSCLKSTQERMRKFKDEGVVISVDHENAILCHGLITATMEDFEFIWHLHQSTLDPERRMFYLKVIGCIESEEILMEFMGRMFEGKNEWKDILRAAYSNHRIGLRATLDFMNKNYNQLIGLLLDLDEKSSLDEIFREIATRVNDASMSSILSDLLAIYNVNAITREEVNSIVNDNLQWLDAHSNNIRIFLNDFHNASTSLALRAISYLVIIFGLASNWIISLMLTETYIECS